MMKGMLKPVFTNAAIFKTIDDFARNKIEKVMQMLAYVGERVSNDAKSSPDYKDQTSNLRSSVGYCVAFNGKITEFKAVGKPKGVKKAREVANEVISKNTIGAVLVVFAGMEYAQHVENTGRSVITGAIPSGEKLIKYFKKELKV